jgi:hypothetical protein
VAISPRQAEEECSCDKFRSLAEQSDRGQGRGVPQVSLLRPGFMQFVPWSLYEGLLRFHYGSGSEAVSAKAHLHFVTFSCYRRERQPCLYESVSRRGGHSKSPGLDFETWDCPVLKAPHTCVHTTSRGQRPSECNRAKRVPFPVFPFLIEWGILQRSSSCRLPVRRREAGCNSRRAGRRSSHSQLLPVHSGS